MEAKKGHTIIPTVSMPSSDLIVYRFDQTDKKIEGLDKKMDDLVTAFATKEELNVITARMDNYIWYWRAIVTALLFCIGGVIATLVKSKGGI